MIEIKPLDLATLSNQAANLFTETFSAQPAGIWAAPGRVNLIGDHVDYAHGVSIPFALNLYTVVALSPNNTTSHRIISLLPNGTELKAEVEIEQISPENTSGWKGYIAGTFWAMGITTGIDVAIISQVPLGSGLSSSAALECAVALAARDVFHLELDNPSLATAAMRAENEIVGASTGGLDQQAVLYGQENQALVLDFHSHTRELVPANFSAQGLALLIANTNAPHKLSDGQYGSRRGLVDKAISAVGILRNNPDAPEKAAQILGAEYGAEVVRRRIEHVIEETNRTLEAATALKQNDLAEFRKLMQASHESLRDKFEVVTPELECAFQAAGKYGARMTGGGFGGSVIALVPETDLEATKDAILRSAEQNSFPDPSFLVATASRGAHRIS